MDIRKFRIISKRLQIISLIEEADSFLDGVIWQPTSNKRVVYPIDGVIVDGSSEELVITSVSNLEFNNSMPVYVSVGYKGLIFKLNPKSYKYSGDKISSSFPSEARAYDLRKEDRKSIPPKTELPITLIYAGLLANGETKFMVKDFSRGGLGLTASESSRNFFIKNLNIVIKSIGTATLKEQILAQVSYVAPNPSKRGEIKVGLTFKHPLSDSQFQLLFEKVPAIN